MNTDIRMVAVDPISHPAFIEAERFFRAFERRFSRFLPDSELSQLNRSTGAAFVASDEMLSLLTLALEMHRRTDGLFDPCVLTALEAAGYDRSFELVPADGEEAQQPIGATRFALVSIDVRGNEVRLPPGARIDLGGIGKGYAVDRAAELLAPLVDVLIDAGGDIAARGDGPDGDGWVVSIADPFDADRDLTTLRLHDEAIATSTTLRRRWRRSGEQRHHLIDPRTGRSADTDLVQVSVIAPSAVEADVFAKCALILGEERGVHLIDTHGYAACYVRTNETLSATGAWPQDATIAVERKTS